MSKNKTRIIGIILVIFILVSIVVSCGKKELDKMSYYDLSQESKYVKDEYKNEYKYSIVDDQGSKNSVGNKYLAHPDMINKVAPDGKNIQYIFYVDGHGRGATRIKKSEDNGKTWTRIGGLPDSFTKTQETPCIYKLNFTDGSVKYILISARPGWSTVIKKGEGFDVSISEDLEKWEPHENFYGPNAKQDKYKREKGKWNAIVAMAAFHQIKENGKFVDKWAGYFHDYDYKVYRTVLEFSNGKMQWSEPKPIFSKYRNLEKKAGFCEPNIVRSPDGNELMMLIRTNNKRTRSMMSFSSDEGKTWGEPKETAVIMTGERHKIIYLDKEKGRLMVTMRKINFYNNKPSKKNFYSRGFMAYIGTYEQIKSGKEEGDIFKIEHTYLDNQDDIDVVANGDTGYAGIIKTTNGLVVLASYGRFKKGDKTNTCIIAKTIDVKKLDERIANNGIKKIEE